MLFLSQRITSALPFCTLTCPHTQTALPYGGRKLHHLCEHFGVTLEGAHDARADTRALAECVAEAWRRGVMLPEFATPELERPELKRKASHMGKPAGLCCGPYGSGSTCGAKDAPAPAPAPADPPPNTQ